MTTPELKHLLNTIPPGTYWVDEWKYPQATPPRTEICVVTSDFRIAVFDAGGPPYSWPRETAVASAKALTGIRELIAEVIHRRQQLLEMRNAMLHIEGACRAPWMRKRLEGASPNNDVEVALKEIRRILEETKDDISAK